MNGATAACADLCPPLAIQDVASSDDSLGLTVVDLANAYLGDADLTWYDGTTTTIHVTGGAQASATLQAKLARDSVCGELCTEAGYSLSTDDGKLANESLALSSGYGFGVTVLTGSGAPPFFIPAKAEISLSMLHGSFKLPPSWGAAVETATLTVNVSPKADLCTYDCGPGPGPSWAWSTPRSLCGYDGKVSLEFDLANGCPQDVVVATWRWH
jgi:hypothetical protein